jgi:hypothetical protein
MIFGIFVPRQKFKSPFQPHLLLFDRKSPSYVHQNLRYIQLISFFKWPFDMTVAQATMTCINKQFYLTLPKFWSHRSQNLDSKVKSCCVGDHAYYSKFTLHRVGLKFKMKLHFESNFENFHVAQLPSILRYK